MRDLFWGIGLLQIAFLVHVLIWRIRVPNRQGRAILVVFTCVLVLGLMAKTGLAPSWTFSLEAMIEELWLSATWIPLYISFVLAYLISFTALEAESPSIEIIRQLRIAGDEGILAEELAKRITKDQLVGPRISDLVRDKMISEHECRYSLTKKGALLDKLFTYQRSVLRLGLGG